jgi:hypothetical protein
MSYAPSGSNRNRRRIFSSRVYIHSTHRDRNTLFSEQFAILRWCIIIGAIHALLVPRNTCLRTAGKMTFLWHCKCLTAISSLRWKHTKTEQFHNLHIEQSFCLILTMIFISLFPWFLPFYSFHLSSFFFLLFFLCLVLFFFLSAFFLFPSFSVHRSLYFLTALLTSEIS